MKKTVLLLFFVLIACAPAIAGEMNAGSAPVYYGTMPYPVLTQGQSIQQSANLSLMADRKYYDEHKKDAVLPLVLNFFLGFGIGSFVEGDDMGGLIMAGTQVLGFAMAMYGSTRLSNAHGEWLCAYGVMMMVASRIWGFIRPWTYASKYNDDLREKIAAGDIRPVSIDAFPAVDASGALAGGMTVRAKVGF